jgi:hypothetical protein
MFIRITLWTVYNNYSGLGYMGMTKRKQEGFRIYMVVPSDSTTVENGINLLYDDV